MKTIQLIGNNFPKIRYAFMSKIKPNTEVLNIDSNNNLGNSNIFIFKFLFLFNKKIINI